MNDKLKERLLGGGIDEGTIAILESQNVSELFCPLSFLTKCVRKE